MSVEFEALKAATEKLIADNKAKATRITELEAQVANPPAPPAADPLPQDVAALTAEIEATLPPA